MEAPTKTNTLYIDGDAHFWPLDMLDRVSHRSRGHMEVGDGQASYFRDGKLVQSFSEPRWDLSKRLDVMDAEGFDLQVLIPDNRPLVYTLDRDLGCELAQAYNNSTAEAIAAHNRFVGVSWVYLPDVEEAVRELRRSVEELGFPAVKLMGPPPGSTLSDENLWPFYEEAVRLDVPLLVHSIGVFYREDGAPPMTQWALGNSFNYMTSISDLIFGGVLDRFPTLRIAFFEGGVGWVPFLMTRLHNQVQRGQQTEPNPRVLTSKGPEELPRSIASYFQQIYIAAISWESYLPHIAQMWPDHNIIIGSDFNHGDAVATWPNTTAPVLAMEGLSVEDTDRILGGNAVRLLGFDRHPQRTPQGKSDREPGQQ